MKPSLLFVLLACVFSRASAQSKDTLYGENSYYLEYKIDGSTTVQESKAVRFYKSGIDNDLLISEVNFSVDTLDGREQSFNLLTVKAFEKTSNYKKTRWTINATYETPQGPYSGEYYVSVVSGCCGAEDEFQFYSLTSGKKLFSTTSYKWCSNIYRGMYAYLSDRTMNSSIKTPMVIGEILLLYGKSKESSAKRIKLQILSKVDADALNIVTFTPDIIEMEKDAAIKRFYQYAPLLSKINAKQFLCLDYYDEHYIFIPFDNGIPLISRAILSNPNLKLQFAK